MNHFRHAAFAAVTGAMLTAVCAFSAPAFAAGPEIVAGPASDPACFVPWSDKTKFFKFPAKKGPYRIALANGFIANTWRIQMIQTAKAYAAQPEVAAKLKEFKVVSTGEDVAAQIAAINNFINSGYDAIVIDAQNPEAFKPVIKRAKEAGVVLVAFDNTLDTEDAINVDVDQKGLGVYWAQWLDKHLPNGGKILEVRGVSGTSVDRDRHDGIHETLDKTGKKWDVVEVYGKWDDPTAQKVTADAIAVQKHFDGYHRAGRRHRRRAGDARRQAADGAVRRRDRERLPQVLRQASGEGAEVRVGRQRAGAGRGRDPDGDCGARGQGRAAVDQAAARDRRGSELQGRRELLFQARSDNFFVGNSFPTCNINFSARWKSWGSRRRTSNRRRRGRRGQRSAAAAREAGASRSHGRFEGQGLAA